jgi:hypothetical protein
VTTYALAPLKLAAIRLTLLDSCGVPSVVACASFSYKSVVLVEQTGETVDATEFPLVNADAQVPWP